ncbi:MAG TPA: MBL fold metallo-hydrolase [Gemmatimonadaceae bacterium]|nr:MBL fold metallo-hydrolase [Gemmatimonadaceae bacterium]
MRLTTLGTGTASPSRRVNAGHLVEAGDVTLLMDCGSGVVHRMGTLGANWLGITHLALTHFHPDHTLDLATLIFAWRYGALPPRSAPLTILGPVGTAQLIEKFAAIYGDTIRAPGFQVTVRELAPGERAELGDGVTLEARKVPHTAESVAYCVERGGARLVFTGDTAFDTTLAEWAHGCDLLLAECSLPEQLAVATHLTPAQCGVLAEVADPGRLVLTHFYPPVEEEDIREIISLRYSGEIVLAVDGWSTDIEEL